MSRAAVQFTNSIGMKLTRIPAGRFLMGSPTDELGRGKDEGPQHEVTITRPFYLGVHPVTQCEYEVVMGRNPSRFAGNPVRPVETVSWKGAVAFCKRLSANPKELQAGRVYRLPTEAEWEYACRAGTTTAYSFGVSLSTEQANINGVPGRTTDVGSYPANPWGLHDMHGNVWEWCGDWYDKDSYRNSDVKDPQGPQAGAARVVRGGSWFNGGWNFRSACRLGYAPGYRVGTCGFRVACLVASGHPAALP